MKDIHRYEEYINATIKPILLIETEALYILPKNSIVHSRENQFGDYLVISKGTKIVLNKKAFGVEIIKKINCPTIINVKNIHYCDVISKKTIKSILEG